MTNNKQIKYYFYRIWVNVVIWLLNTIEELFSHLEKRQGILKGLVISGGEPLINPYTPLIIKKARELG